MREAILVVVTVPSIEAGETLAEALVGDGLAACVSLVGEVRSIYRWKGAIERAREQLCVIKTTRDVFETLRARVIALHPYEVPEVVALPIVAGHGPYLDWIASAVTAPKID